MRAKPDRSFKQGDLSAVGRPRFQGAWNIESDFHVSSTDLADHLTFVVRFTTRHKKKILALKKTMRAGVRIRILWDFEDATIVFGFESSTLVKLMGVVDGIDISIT